MNDELDTAGAVSAYLGGQGFDPAVPLRQSVAGAVDTNPDLEAELRRVAKRTGVPLVAARAAPDEVKRAATLQGYDFGQMVQQFPNTAAFLMNQDNARVAHDDSPVMQAIEALSKGLSASYSGLQRASSGVVGVVQMPFDLTAPLLDPLVGTVLPGNPLRATAEGLAGYRQRIDAAAQGNMPKAESIVGAGVYSGLGSLATNVATLPLALFPGGQGAALAGMVAPVGGQAYGEATDKGVPVLPALGFAASQTAIEYATEKIPLGRLVGDLKAGAGFLKTLAHNAATEIPGEQIATVLQDMNEWVVLHPEKTAADYLAERPSAAAQTLIATLVGVGGQVGTVKLIDAAVQRATGQQRDAAAAEQRGQALAQLATLAEASKLRERDPESFATFAQSLTEGNVPHLYVDPRELQKAGVDLGALAQAMPSVAAQTDALATGGDLVIPTAEFLTGAPGQEFLQPLLEHARTAPDAMSPAEAKVYMQEQGDALQAEVARVLAEKQGDDTFAAGRDQVRDEFLRQLDEAKRFTPDVNKAYATLIANFYAVQAARLGITPTELVQRYRLQVQGEVVQGERVMEQAPVDTPEFRNWFGDSKVVDAQGKPLTVYRGGATENWRDGSPITEFRSANGPWAGFFTSKKEVASRFANAQLPMTVRGGAPAGVFPVLLQISNPLEVDAGERPARDFQIDASVVGRQDSPLREQMLSGGYDGLIVRNTSDEGDVFVPLKPEQIKSAIGNRGTFDPNDANILNQSARGFDAWVGDATRVDIGEAHEFKDGEPVVVAALHGTTGDFTTFDKSMANIESDLGGGFYFTNNPADVGENYAGMGPDLTQKIQLEAERLESNDDLDPDEAQRIARDKWMANDGLTMPVWVKFENPVVLGGSRETFLTYEESYDEETDQYGEPTGTLIDLIEALREVGNDERYGDGDIEQVISDIMEKAMEGGGISARDFIAAAKLSEGLVYVTDYESEGNLASTEVLRKAFEGAGFDGFIDTTVNDKFGSNRDTGKQMAGMDEDTVHFIAFKPTQIKSRLGNNGEFDPSNPDILKQGARGQIALGQDLTLTPSVISLFKGADLSTFLHESGHFFLEMQADLAARIQGQIAEGASVSDGEREIVADMGRLLAWFGVKDTPERTALQQWHDMTTDEKRAMHEQFARGFEAYAFEGRAPSLELQAIFQRFRAWLLNIYRELKGLNVELTDDVRGVMDRMIATGDQIREAEAARQMGALFQTPEQAGMTPEEFKAYHDLAIDATQVAMQRLQAKGLRDMQWLANARDRELKKLQRRAAALRRETQMEVRAEVMSQPVYRAWQFLTGKGDAGETARPEAKPKATAAVDPSRDNLFAAIAKLGGLRRDEVTSQWGVDPKDKLESGVFGKPVVRKEGGLSLDAMLERLVEEGYIRPDENGRGDPADLEAAFDAQRRGEDVHSLYHDYSAGRVPEAPIPEGANFGKLRTSDVRLDNPDQLATLVERRMVQEKDGLAPDVVAELFGFDSGDALIRALADAQPPREVIEGMTDQRMLERHGDLGTPEGLLRAADQAIHSEARARFISTELAALERAGKVREPGASGRSTVDVLARAAREYAAGVVARLKVRDLRPGQYAAAEVRAAKAAGKALAAGDTAEAAAQKRNQLIQHEASRAAYAAQDEVEKILGYLRRFDKRPKGLDAMYMDQIEQLLERFDLRQGVSLKAVDKRRTLAQWVESQREQGLEPDVPEELLNEAFRQSYKDMTLEELRGLKDTVKQIEHLGRLKNRLLTAKSQREFEAIRDEITDSIVLHAGTRQADTRTPSTVLGRKLQALRNFGAAHIKAATWARVFDGGKDGGPVWEYLIRSANERGDQETTMRAEATAALHAILEPVLKAGKMGGKGKFFASIGRSMNREQVIAMALNTGNEGNFQRMLGGENWTPAQVQPVLATLTAAEWRAVQAVWDHFESYRPAIGAKERRVYGKEPAWVEPVPRQVVTADGQTLDLRGGYYPIKYDPLANNRAEQHADAETAKRQLQGAYTSATTRRGFTKARAEEVNGRPLLYSLAGVYSGVNDVIHDLAWHEWLIDANKILRSDKIDGAIREHYGPAAVRQLKTWVADVATGEQGLQAELDGVLGRLRHGISVAGLGFNVMSAAMQPLGLTQSIVRVGAQWVGKGLAQYVAAPIAKTREVNEKSEFMAGRARTRFRELNELRNQVEGQTAARRAIGTSAYFLMMRCQQMVDVPTWLGAYEKAVAEGNEEGRAVALADQAVLDAQGGGQTKDLSAIERGGPAQKLFTVFYSFMNTALNAGVAKTMTADTPAKRAKLAVDYLMLYTVPAVLGALLKDALTPGDSGDDDTEKLMRKLLAEQLGYLMGLMVVVREFGEAGKTVAGLNDRPRDYAGPAGVRIIADTGTLAKQIQQGELDDSFRKAAVNLLGDLFALPAAQINRTVTGAKALAEGQTTNPAALVFGFQKP